MEWVRRGHPIIVVESPLTVLRLASWDLPNVVATFGSWGVEQAMSLIGASRIMLWPDNDAAGSENLARIEPVLSQYTEVLVVPLVPGDKSDPSDLADISEVHRYTEAAYPATLLPMNGLVIGV